jgi:Rrf2 family protein
MVALTYLAKEKSGKAVLSTEIAKNEKIPQRFLENILLELKKLGVLGSKKGKEGGYFLLKPAEEITLLDIVRHFEGSIALLYCVSEKAYQPCEFCKEEATCKIRSVFRDIREHTINLLQNTTLQSLL